MATVRDICKAAINKAVGRTLSEEEIDDAVAEVEAAIKAARQTDTVADIEGAVLANLTKAAEDRIIAAHIEKRNAALNALRTKEMIDFVNKNFSSDPMRGFESILLGTQDSRKGARMSIAARQSVLRDEYLAGVIHDLETSGNLPYLSSGKMDKEIMRALWDMDAETPKYPNLQKEAIDTAKIIHKWQEVARKDANEAGALIGKLEGYIMRQSHHRRKLLKYGGDEWKADMNKWLDQEKTFKGSDGDKALDKIYRDLASDVHLDLARPVTGLKGVANVGKSLSHERTLHFKDADAFFEYNQKYGTGNVREAMLSGLMSNAEKTGLMRAAGPNAELNIRKAVDYITDRQTDLEVRNKLNTAINEDGRLHKQFRVVSGVANKAVDETAATIGAVTRGVQSMSKLGGATLSAITDTGIIAHTLADNGSSFLGSMSKSIGDIVDSVGGAPADKKEVAHSIGIFADSMIGDIGARFSGNDDLPGSMSRLMQTYFKFNGLTWWTDSARRSAGLMLANNMERNLKKSYSAINADLRRNMMKYGIDEAEWKVVQRARTISDGRGNDYVTPSNIKDVADSYIDDYLESTGKKATAYSRREARRDITDRVRAYITDQSEHAVIMPDKKTQFMTLGGSRPGTWSGEIARFVMQFKQFPTGVLQKTVGGTLFGRGYKYDSSKGVARNALQSLLENGNGEVVAIARMIGTMTLLGYASMSAKDLFKGKKPRNPEDHKTWMAAMAQGGGLGIYGDFLFGEMRNRFGGGFVNTVAGPTAGSVNQVFDLWGRMKEGEDVGAAAFRTTISNLPFANVFYARPVLNYFILNDIQEQINPGSLRRLQDRQRREMDTEYWDLGGVNMQPSEQTFWSN
jgi:hypothetical protein